MAFAESIALAAASSESNADTRCLCRLVNIRGVLYLATYGQPQRVDFSTDTGRSKQWALVRHKFA